MPEKPVKSLKTRREQSEKIVDALYETLKDKILKKPRTYRQIARKDYLEVAKQRRSSRKKKRKAIKKQLQYLKRNLSHIEQLIESGADLKSLRKRQYKMLLVVNEVYRKQVWLAKNNKQSIEDRIVSLSQPQLRPIIRGKVGKAVEFGAKVSASCFRDSNDTRAVLIMTSDEGRFGRTGELACCWCPPGDTRPTLSRQQVRQYIYAYAAIAPYERNDVLFNLALCQHEDDEFIPTASLSIIRRVFHHFAAR
jgi:hypothetical protein